MQKKLADGNSVSEAALGSMSTVRTFDAADAVRFTSEFFGIDRPEDIEYREF